MRIGNITSEFSIGVALRFGMRLHLVCVKPPHVVRCVLESLAQRCFRQCPLFIMPWNERWPGFFAIISKGSPGLFSSTMSWWNIFQISSHWTQPVFCGKVVRNTHCQLTCSNTQLKIGKLNYKGAIYIYIYFKFSSLAFFHLLKSKDKIFFIIQIIKINSFHIFLQLPQDMRVIVEVTEGSKRLSNDHLQSHVFLFSNRNLFILLSCLLKFVLKSEYWKTHSEKYS